MPKSEALKRAQAKYKQTEAYKESNRKTMKKLRQDPEYKAKEREYLREYRRRKKATGANQNQDNAPQ